MKPGAPVLTMMSIVEPDGTRFDITPEATVCEAGLKDGDACDPAADNVCHTSDADWCKCNPVPEPMPPEEPPCTPETMEADAGSDAAATEGGTDGGASDAASDAGSDAAASDAAASDAAASDAAASDAAASDAGDAAASEGGASEGGASDAAASDAGASDAGETAGPKGTWSCKIFAPGSKVIATFDRLLDTAALKPANAIATATVKTAVTPAPAAVTDYTPNGSTGGLIFPLFGENPGPNLSIVPDPSWPATNTVTVALSKTKVLAKDGKTPFESSGAIIDGVVAFKTSAFSAGVTVPPNAFPPAEESDAGTDAASDASDAGTDAASDASDAGTDAASDASDAAANPDACMPPPPPPPEPTTALADMTPVTIAFTAGVDPAEIVKHVTITAGGKDYSDQVDIKADAASVTITPKTTWATSTTFVIAVDDKAVDVFGDKIDGAAEGTFTTGDK